MADIGVRRQLVAHLHKVHALTLHAQVDRAFTAGESAAEDDHVVRHLVFLFVVVIHHDDVVTAEPRNRRHQRCGARCDDQRVRILFLHIFRRDFRMEADLNTGLLRQQLIRAGQFIHLVLERQCLLALQDPADFVLLLAEDHLMSAAGGSVCRVQTAGPGADDQNLLSVAFPHWRHLDAVHLPPDERIDGTAPRGRRRPLRHARETSQTAHDLVIPVLHDLSGKLRIRQQRAGHIDDVRLSGSDDLFHLRRVVQTADRGDRLGYMLFDLRRKMYVAAVFRKHRRMRAAESPLVSACGDMDDIRIRLDHLCDGDPFFQSVSLRHQFGAAHPELQREERPHRLSDRFQDFHCEAAAVLRRSSVFVRAVIEHRGQELIDEPAVSAMDHQHLEARPLRQSCDMCIRSNDLIDHILRQFPHLDAVRSDCRGRAPLVHGFLSVLIRHIRSGKHAGMRQFQRGDRAVAADRVGRIGRRGKRIENALIQMICMGTVCRRMDHKLRDRNGCRAASGPKFIESRGLRTDTSVVRNIRTSHRRGKHTVAEHGPADRDRTAQMRVLPLHRGLLSLRTGRISSKVCTFPSYCIRAGRYVIILSVLSLFCAMCTEGRIC